MSKDPFKFGSMLNSKGQTIEFYEHPILGDEAEVICVCHELKTASNSTFYDTADMEAEHGEYEPWFDENGKLNIGELGPVESL